MRDPDAGDREPGGRGLEGFPFLRDPSRPLQGLVQRPESGGWRDVRVEACPMHGHDRPEQGRGFFRGCVQDPARWWHWLGDRGRPGELDDPPRLPLRPDEWRWWSFPRPLFDSQRQLCAHPRETRAALHVERISRMVHLTFGIRFIKFETRYDPS